MLVLPSRVRVIHTPEGSCIQLTAFNHMVYDSYVAPTV